MNTKYFIGLCVGILLIAGGAFFFLTRQPAQEEEIVGIAEEEIPEISADEIGLTLEAKPDNKAVKFAISNPEGIKSISYELSYVAKTDDGEEVNRATTGSLDVKSIDKIIESNYIDLGTCSSGVCKYDKGVSSVKLILKIVKEDGSIYQAGKTLAL